jgi:hypothetical protein
MSRLYFYVAIAFVTSFAAVSWAARGFPMHWSGPASVSSLQQSPPLPKMPQGNGRASPDNEADLVKGREKQRQYVLRVLDRPWGSRCTDDGRALFIDGLSYYYDYRYRQMESYRQTYGKAGADYIAAQFSKADDSRIERLTQEAYAKGYLKPEDFRGAAGQMVATVVKGERVIGKGCAG